MPDSGPFRLARLHPGALRHVTICSTVPWIELSVLRARRLPARRRRSRVEPRRRVPCQVELGAPLLAGPVDQAVHVPVLPPVEVVHSERVAVVWVNLPMRANECGNVPKCARQLGFRVDKRELERRLLGVGLCELPIHAVNPCLEEGFGLRSLGGTQIDVLFFLHAHNDLTGGTTDSVIDDTRHCQIACSLEWGHAAENVLEPAQVRRGSIRHHPHEH